MLTVGSLFAGIGGFDAGFDRAGFRCLWQVERDPACLRVLERHWPDTLRLDDVCKAGSATLPRVDIITGGFPCQDLSVAGKRAGLAGKRSGLFHEAIRIVRELRPDLVVLENVPGLISSHGGHDFLIVLRSLRKCGALDIAWRTLDSRYFNVAQRRNRVFIVADFSGKRAGQILFESPCGCGGSPTRGEAGPRVAATIRSRSHAPGINPPGRGGEDDQNLVFQANGSGSFRTGAPSCSASDDNGSNNVVVTGRKEVVNALDRHMGMGGQDDNAAQAGHVIVSHSLRCEGADASEDGTGRGTPIVAQPLRSNIHNNSDPGMEARMHVRRGTNVRRLMPIECLRLQAFPDDWLDLMPPLSDSAKYRMIGNAVTVTVAEWIAKRISAQK